MSITTSESVQIKTITSTTNNEGDLFLRMMRLKDMYELQRRELGVGLPREYRSSRIAPDSSDSEEIQIDGEDYEEENEEENKESNEGRRNNKRKKAMSKAELSALATSVQGMQTTIKAIIERHGGSCHMETIVEFVKMKWQKEGIVKADGGVYGHADCKKAVQSNFRTRANNRLVFTRDKDNEGCWMITPSPEEEQKIELGLAPEWQPLANAVSDAIEDHGGICYIDSIYKHVKENWKMKPLSDGSEMRDKDVELLIRVNLSTHPKFIEDEEHPDHYIFNGKKKRKGGRDDRPNSTNHSVGNGGSNGAKSLVSRRRRGNGGADEDDDEDEFHYNGGGTPAGGSGLSTRRKSSNRDSAPPLGYSCRCGATDPSNGGNSSNNKWKRGPSGEFVCHKCFLQETKRQACPVCGKMYRKNDKSTDEEENAWIRCDDCHRWVMNKCDPSLEDLSVYDDSNPNHLHYSCPICRAEDYELLCKPLFGQAVAAASSSKSSAKQQVHHHHHNVVEHAPPLPSQRSSRRNHAFMQEEESEVDDLDALEGRLENTERELLDRIVEEFEMTAAQGSSSHSVSYYHSYGEGDLTNKLRYHEDNFTDDISRYSAQLIGKRERQLHKHQLEMERQIKRLKEEKERQDEMLEVELVQDLKNYYRQLKKEYDKIRYSLLKKEEKAL